MLTLFKPWRHQTNIKGQELDKQSWDETFLQHPFTEHEKRLMRNFNIRYECLDARDDFRAQMKKGTNPIIGSWDAEAGEEQENEQPYAVAGDDNSDDLPVDPLNCGPNHTRRMKQTEVVNNMMTTLGWTVPLQSVDTNSNQDAFEPEKKLAGSVWEQVVARAKRAVIGKKNEYNVNVTPTTGDVAPTPGQYKPYDPNVVKIVDKSYLEKDFRIENTSELVDATIREFSLNEEQDRAFRIIANHAISHNPEQLRMYLGGMGGTGKSQVIKALSHFFKARKEEH